MSLLAAPAHNSSCHLPTFFEPHFSPSLTSQLMSNLFFCCFFFISLPPAKPKNSANVVTVQAGSKSVVVAQCEAADGKPAATIKWLASVGGNHSTSTTNGPDGTVTVRSEYRLVPTPADNGREVSCRVDQRTQQQPWVYPIKLSVECKRDTHNFTVLVLSCILKESASRKRCLDNSSCNIEI